MNWALQVALDDAARQQRRAIVAGLLFKVGVIRQLIPGLDAVTQRKVCVIGATLEVLAAEIRQLGV